MPRPPLTGPGRTGSPRQTGTQRQTGSQRRTGSRRRTGAQPGTGPTSPRATGAAGRSALEVWRQERRSRRRRLVLIGVLALASVAAIVTWLAVTLGFARVGGPAWPLLMVAGVATVASIVFWPRSDPSRWARGAAGETVTAAILESLPRRRWVVLHDLALPGSRANVDHLVIGPTGVWVVDTKAYRARVTVRWRHVLVAGAPLQTGPVRWEAEVVSASLGVTARPVVAMHANGLQRRGRRVDGVRVVPAAQLVHRLRRGRRLWRRLRPREVLELGELAEKLLARRW